MASKASLFRAQRARARAHAHDTIAACVLRHRGGFSTAEGVYARNTHDVYCGSNSTLPAVCCLTLSHARTCSRGHTQHASACTCTDASDSTPLSSLSRRRVQHHEDSGAGVMSAVAPGASLIENFHKQMHAHAYLDRQTDRSDQREDVRDQESWQDLCVKLHEMPSAKISRTRKLPCSLTRTHARACACAHSHAPDAHTVSFLSN